MVRHVMTARVGYPLQLAVGRNAVLHHMMHAPNLCGGLYSSVGNIGDSRCLEE
jgi:hypothetical protein